MAARSRRAGGPEPAGLAAAVVVSAVWCPGCGLPLADMSLIVHEGCSADPRAWVSVSAPS